MYTIHATHRMDGPLVQVAGYVGDAAVADLLQSCRPDAKVVRIDLRDLVTADAAVLRTLRALERSGAIILNAPRHVRIGLDTIAAADGQLATTHAGLDLQTRERQ